MRTFTGNYSNRSFQYSGDNEALRAQLISILNTPKGSRFYYPSYGSHLNEYRFSILNHFSINMIGQEIKTAITLIDGVTLSAISYSVAGNTLYFTIDLNKMSNTIRLNLSIVDGVAY